jgi:predicted Zn-dependent protease
VGSDSGGYGRRTPIITPMRVQRVLFALFLSLSAVACATNPATGRTELNFYSEEQEIALGREAHDEILREFYVYDEKPELNDLVDEIGQRVAAKSPRPNLPWTFTLLDTPMVNAMALPGGYVYVTRGILERMNSEDELAGVIGHEVAHVAARHGTHSMSTGTMMQIGLVAAAVIAGEENVEKYGALAWIGAGLLFTKYSRQQETEADVLGTKYMATTGYNPIGAENMLQGLQRLGGTPDFLERYFMDHPDPAKRVQDIRREIATLNTADASMIKRGMNRDRFVRALDGMVTGNSTSDTTVRNGVAYNRTYGLVARAPRGWTAVVESGTLFALHRQDGKGVVYAQELTAEELAEFDGPRAAVRAQLEEMGLTHQDQLTGRTGSGERVTIDRWSGKAEDGTEYEIESTQHRAGDGAVVFLHIGSGQGLDDLLDNVRIDPSQVRAIKTPRLRIAQVRSGDTWQTLARRATGNTEDAAEIAHINGFDFPSDVPAGMVVKLPEEVAKPVE